MAVLCTLSVNQFPKDGFLVDSRVLNLGGRIIPATFLSLASL